VDASATNEPPPFGRQQEADARDLVLVLVDEDLPDERRVHVDRPLRRMHDHAGKLDLNSILSVVDLGKRLAHRPAEMEKDAQGGFGRLDRHVIQVVDPAPGPRLPPIIPTANTATATHSTGFSCAFPFFACSVHRFTHSPIHRFTYSPTHRHASCLILSIGPRCPSGGSRTSFTTTTFRGPPASFT
jgi:hypothetical protein